VADTREPVTDEPEPSRFERLRARFPWLDHLVRAATRYTERHGDHYAAAITFFSILSLVPLIMIAFSVAGYVLFLRPDLLDQLREAIGDNLPAELSTTVDPIIDQAIDQRNTVAGVGLLIALYTGVAWMTNLREALSEQWAQPPAIPALPKRLFFDLLALAGLGLALVASFAITGVSSAFTGEVVELLGLDRQGWAEALLGVLGIVLAVAANWLVFLWVIARLPRRHVPLRRAAPAALLGAVGFEILKWGMAIYLGRITETPSGAVFGSLLGLLIFAFFVSRFLLFVTAWAATGPEEQEEEPAVAGPAVIRSEVTVRSGPDGRTAAALVGVGFVTGLLGEWLRGRRRR
jgi:membrane protein